jgi:hypothetical protein
MSYDLKTAQEGGVKMSGLNQFVTITESDHHVTRRGFIVPVR